MTKNKAFGIRNHLIKLNLQKKKKQMFIMANTWGESVGPGDSVIYVPNHAFEDGKPNFNHPSCEYGIIKSAQSRYIFVNYVVNGIVQGTAKATDPRNLFLLNGESLFDLIEVFNKIKNK